MELEYTMGASTATLTVDGVAVAGVRSTTDGAISSFNQLHFGMASTYATELNIDAESPATPRTATPSFSPDGGTYIRGRSVTISCTTPDSTIRYTTDGSTPADDNTTGTVYTGPVAIPDIPGATTLNARAFASGYDASLVKTGTYTVTHDRLIVYANFDNDTAGANPIDANIQVALGRTAWWQIFKPGPYPEDIQVVDDNITVGNKVLRMDYPNPEGAIEKVLLHLNMGVAVEDLAPSEVVRTSFKFRFLDTWPLPENSFMGYWALGDNATGHRHACGIMYNSAAWPGYPMSSGNTGQALLQNKGQVLNRWYLVERIIDLDNDTFIGVITDLVTGDTDSDGTPSPLAYYSYGGEMQTISGLAFDSQQYTMPAHLEFDDLKIEIGDPPPATPTFSPDGGTYVESQTVTITCATDNATIRYTTDGSTPAADNTTGTIYTGPVSVTSTTTLKARAFAPNQIASVVKSAYYFMARPMPIPHGSVTVDGDLGDWSDVTWAPLDQNYYQTAPDIAQAFYAVKWTVNKLYVAVKVQDTTQTFTPIRLDWNSADCVEIYVHTTGAGPTNYFDNQTDAQQYTVGVRSDNISAVWSIIGDNHTILPAYGFTAAGKKNLTWLQYEVAITPYETFNLSGTGLVTSPLSLNQVIGVDVIADSRYGVGEANFGMKSENLLGSTNTDKYANYQDIALHKLGPQTSYTNVDLAAVLAAMDSTQAGGGTWNPDVDLDNDQEITSSDLAIVLENLE
ncbi:MAG: chitobiase/beta-hexosaminidase C-terminal domain-containing protein [Phycisphaerae bacterium]